MADKSTKLILDALVRAAVEPDGFALLASKVEPGLFPPSTLARTAAERCKQDGYLQVIRSEAKGKLEREFCTLTPKGLQYLVQQSNPRQVLEDFVRVLETRQAEIKNVSDGVCRIQQSLQSMRTAIEH